LSSLSFQYPSFYIVLVLLIAALFTGLLYFRNSKQKDIPPHIQITLGVLRFVSIALIGFLLLGPLIKRTETEIQKPIVLVAMDNSASIGQVHDSLFLANLMNDLQGVNDNLKEEYEFRFYHFGEQMIESKDPDFTGRATNIGEVFESAYNQYGAENLSAVIIASDGIYNEGRDPVYALERLKVPVFSIQLGDTTQRRDLKIKKIFHNNIAYLGDRFKVQVDISAYNLAGKKSILTVSEVSGQGGSKQDFAIEINQSDYFKTIEVELEAKQPGVRRFRFSLSPVEGEWTTANNSREIFVDVLDSRQKILILANSPHPDVAAIRQVLERNKNFEVTQSLLRDFKLKIADFNLVIFHQLPAKGSDIRPLVKTLESAEIPRMFIIGQQSDLNVLNALQTAVRVRSNVSKPNEVQAKLVNSFSLFTLEDRTRSKIGQFVPLAAPFGEYTLGAGVDVLLNQRIGQVETDFPLLLFQSTNTGKIAIFLAEGFYKWRLFDYLQHENNEISNEIIQKTITFLNVKEDRRRFRAYSAKNIFDENEPISFGAELYNESYEQINDPDAHIRIVNEDGKEFPFVFNKRGKGYFIEPGLFPVGQYSYNAYTEYDGKRLEFKGQFSIQPIEKELFELTADHGLLERLSDAFGGNSITSDQVSSLTEDIKNNRRIKALLYETSKTRPAIDLKWIFFILILLFGAEWFARKFYGSY